MLGSMREHKKEAYKRWKQARWPTGNIETVSKHTGT